MANIKNIITFIVVGIALVLAYIFFIKPSTTDEALIKATPVSEVTASLGSSTVANDFLTLLLSVKSIKLDDAVFSDQAFTSLHDSSISLIPDGTEGRPNPFAPLGSDNVIPIVPSVPVSVITPVTPTSISPVSAGSTTMPSLPAVTSPAVGPKKSN